SLRRLQHRGGGNGEDLARLSRHFQPSGLPGRGAPPTALLEAEADAGGGSIPAGRSVAGPAHREADIRRAGRRERSLLALRDCGDLVVVIEGRDEAAGIDRCGRAQVASIEEERSLARELDDLVLAHVLHRGRVHEASRFGGAGGTAGYRLELHV